MEEHADEPGLGKVLGFMQQLWELDHALQTASKRMHAELGVTGLQRMMIRIIGRSPGISAGELAEVLHLHPSTLTGALEKLVNGGFVERTRDDQDRRRARLTLAKKGRALNAIRKGTVEGAVRRALANVSAQELELAKTVLAAISAELEADNPAEVD